MLCSERSEGLHRHQAIQAGAKAGFSNNKVAAGMCQPARRNIVAGNKHMMGFINATVVGKIDVIEVVSNRSAAVVKINLRSAGFHVLIFCKTNIG